MTEPRQAWEQVGNRLSGLGVKLKGHLEHDASDEEKEAVESALKRLGDAIEEAVEAVGNAAKDPAVKSEVKGFGRSLLDALSVTMETASGKVRDVVDKRRNDSAPPPPYDPTRRSDEASTTAATSSPATGADPVPPTPAAGGEPRPDDGLRD